MSRSRLFFTDMIDKGSAMKARTSKSLLIIASALLFLPAACSHLRYVPPVHDPIIRVGILENQEKIYFEPQGPFRIQAAQDKENASLNEPGQWSAQVAETRPGVKHYRIRLFESASEQQSRSYADRMKARGLQVEIKSFGEALRMAGQTLVDRRYYRVLLTQQFDTQMSAELFFKTSANLTNAQVIEEYDQPAGGVVKLTSPQGRSYLVHDRLRLVGTNISLKNVQVGSGYHWAHLESRSYAGELELAVNAAGLLHVVNVVNLEAYLRGVVAGEMPSTFPPEALKAQAIISRTLFMNNFYRFHRGEDFDVCDDVHCQAYIGVTKQNEPASHAVAATNGLVLTFADRLCTATYSAVCGGHTEDAAEVWEGDSQPYLKGDFDAIESGLSRASLDLSNEEKVRLWITSSPKVYCNIESAGDPSFAAYAKKYFRWETSASRQDLQKWIVEKTGVEIGQLVDIIPKHRGLSGRLSEIHIIGTQDSVTVTRELNIRRTLSASALYSACFVINKENVHNGLADTWRFTGAGWGHGVGLCQVGAAVRSLRGQNVAQILSAYYPGTRLKKMY